MGLADLHIHTNFSWDSTCTVRAVLKYASEYTALDVIAITDHDEIAGAIAATRHAPEYGIHVIPGSEISTRDGHLIALFIEQRIPSDRPLVETILRVGDIGGLCIIPHPEAGLGAGGVSASAIQVATNTPGTQGILVGIEAYNAGLVDRASNRRAEAIASTLPLSHVGSSDSHMLFTIGLGATSFEGNHPQDLRLSLLRRQTQVVRGRPVSGIEIVRNWVPRYLLRRVGWIDENTGPKHPIQLSHQPQQSAFQIARS